MVQPCLILTLKLTPSPVFKSTSYSWNAGQQELLEIEADNPSLRLGGNIRMTIYRR
jgi:hypothetical protein